LEELAILSQVSVGAWRAAGVAAVVGGRAYLSNGSGFFIYESWDDREFAVDRLRA